jgi:hypothetical protein
MTVAPFGLAAALAVVVVADEYGMRGLLVIGACSIAFALLTVISAIARQRRRPSLVWEPRAVASVLVGDAVGGVVLDRIRPDLARPARAAQ